jgi:hypothetical protein
MILAPAQIGANVDTKRFVKIFGIITKTKNAVFFHQKNDSKFHVVFKVQYVGIPLIICKSNDDFVKSS